MNTNRLIVLAEPIFSLMSRLILSPENFSEDFRARIEHEFSEFKAQGLTLGLTMQKIENSLYALSAYVDELVLVSTWADRKVWMGQSLQAFYFKEHLAGEKFFERLAILRQQGENEADVLSLYYLCLQLGFQGKYRLLGSEQLHAYLVDFKAQLERYQKKFHLSHKQEVNFFKPKNHWIEKISYWFIGASFLILSLLIYGVFYFADWQQAKTVSNAIAQINWRGNVNNA